MSRVIFVPGIKGTELYNGDNKVWIPKSQKDLKFLQPNCKLKPENPLGIFNAIYKKFNIYQKITQKLNEWFPKNIELFGYDWRDDVYDSRDLLAEDIKDLYEKDGISEKVTIVAHSMGGMIAKLAILKLEEQGLSLVDKIITIGTPWLGAPEAIKVLIYGEHCVFRGTDTITKLFDDKTMRNLARKFPSVYQLLPNKAYYSQKDGKYVRTIDKQEVSFSEIIEEVKTFYNEKDEESQSYKNVDVWMKYVDRLQNDMLEHLPSEIVHECIIGIEVPTLYSLSLDSGEKRKSFKGEFAFKNGDGVVPLISAKSTEGVNTNKYYVNGGEHAYLCSNNRVINLLERLLLSNEKELPKGVYTEEPKNVELTKGKLAMIRCPVDTTILDNKGAYVAGVFDPAKEVSKCLDEENINYFTIGNSKFIFINDEYSEDLNFDIRAYADGITDVSVKIFDDKKTTELDFESIPITSKSSAKLFLPLSEKNIIEVTSVKHDGNESKKVVRTYESERIIISENIPLIDVKIRAANEQVKRTKYNPVFNGNVILEINSTGNVDAFEDDNIKEVLFSVNDGLLRLYNGPIELGDLKNGENIITIIGKDIFNRPLKSITKKVCLDKFAPISNITLKAEPDGLTVTFNPETNGSKAITKYIISNSWENMVNTEWEKVHPGEEIAIPWGHAKFNPDDFISVVFFSENEFGIIETPQKLIKIKLDKIPALMWSEVSTTKLTPRTILSNLSVDFPDDKINELKIFALLGERKKNNLYPLELDSIIKNDVKGIRFAFLKNIIDVMYAEPYSLYFSGPPSEVLRKGQNYKFQFELITERTKERVNYSEPRVTLRKNIRKTSNEIKVSVPIYEKDGIYYGNFSVDETFIDDRHKLIITDNKNIDPALRIITLIMDEVEKA